MKKTITLLLIISFITSCSGVKQTQTMISDGNYDGAINKALENLRTNKTSKSKQNYIYLLEEAFAKAKQRDLQNINIWEKEGNPNQFENIFNTYIQLQNRQQHIQPILPLPLIKEGRNAIFPFDDYSTQIISAKNKLCSYLYENSKKLIKVNDKLAYRKAYDDLQYLNKINPDYKEVSTLLKECFAKGTDYVHVYTKNETNMIIPVRLENDLLDFSTFGLNDKWTVYHSTKLKEIKYDFALLLNFRNINISPEQVKEREFIKEKEINDGKEPLLDTKGNPVKDEKGNIVMVDKKIKVVAQVYEFQQYKSCQITAKIDYIDLKSNQLIHAFPITSQFVFNHIYARHNGDRRACDTNYLTYFNNRQVSFPSTDQMVYDAGEDLKQKLKNVINSNRFRK